MPTQSNSVNVSQQKASFAALLAVLVANLASVLSADPLVLDGETLARSVVLARIQAVMDAIALVKTARTDLLALVAKQKIAVADARKLRSAIKRLAESQLGPASAELQKLGFTPRRVATPKPLTVAKAVVQAAATRKARGTKGKKARLAITAPAPVVTVTEATPASPAAPSVPAATPPKA